MHFDLLGIAAVITAIGVTLGTIGNVVLQIVNLTRQGQMIEAGVVRDQKLDVVHNLVNGQSEKLNEAIRSGAFAAGEKAESDRH
jgi:hypothetical protein